MSMLILGIDAGNHKAKTAGVFGVDSFKTNICDWFEKDVVETFGIDDMEFLVAGRRGYAGSIAEHEDDYGNGTRYGDSKAHEETKIRVLLAVHRYIERYSPGTQNVAIVTGQPITGHKVHEKQKIIDMLKGHHDYTVNGKNRKVFIQDVKVTTEGGGAFWAKPQPGTVRILDIGSGTVNLCTVFDKKFIHKSSGTMNVGMETMRNKNDLAGLSRGIIQAATKLKWSKNDVVWVCGGIAQDILAHIKNHFECAEILNPQLKRSTDILSVQPVYANAIGFYNLAKGAFQ